MPQSNVQCTRTNQIESNKHWVEWSLAERAKLLSNLPPLLVSNAPKLHKLLSLHPNRSLADTIASELLPLATACRWNCCNAKRILRQRSIVHRGLDLFLGRISGTTFREPLGTVLIIGTWNYPLFLTAAPLLQALLTGNEVIVKPAPHCETVTGALIDLFHQAKVPRNVIRLTDSSIQAVDDAMDAGVDLIVLTASSATGRAVAEKAARRLIPVIAELSGCDAMLVLDDADLPRVAAAITFGLRLNGGATCMAPRRLIASSATIDRLLPLLILRLAELTPATCRPEAIVKLCSLVQAAISEGATLVEDVDLAELTNGNDVNAPQCPPIVLDHVQPVMDIAQADIFAPLLSIMRVENDEQLVTTAAQCPYGLTASIFGTPQRATQLAARLQASVVTVNDVIAPTVEPSIGFGGRDESGYGMTRGAEGLRQMTREKSILIRQGNFLPHLQQPSQIDDAILQGLFAATHGPTWKARLAGLHAMLQAGRKDR